MTLDLVELLQLFCFIIPMEEGARLRVDALVEAAEDLGQDGLQHLAVRHEEHAAAAAGADALGEGLHAAGGVEGRLEALEVAALQPLTATQLRKGGEELSEVGLKGTLKSF